MSYVDSASIETRLGTSAYLQLTDDDGDQQADGAVVDEARLGAQGEVDSYLARRYAVPIDLVQHPELTDLLKSVVLDLVELRLRARRPPVSEVILRRHATALEWLRGVADGTIKLPSVVPVAERPTRGPGALTAGEPRSLSREELSSH